MEKNIRQLDPSGLEWLTKYCDSQDRGFIVIPAFVSKVQELGLETPAEEMLRKFAQQALTNGVNVQQDLRKFATGPNPDKLDKQQFKLALKKMGLGLSEEQIELLFRADGPDLLLSIPEFCKRVLEAKNAKAPSIAKAGQKPGDKAAHTGLGAVGGQSSYEAEKKFARTIEALKQEIEDKNKTIKTQADGIKEANARLQRKESENNDLQAKLINRNDKPPQQIKDKSEQEFSVEENMKLKDQIFHLQNVNSELTKSVQVKLKIELAQLMQEKEKAEEKLKLARTQLRQKQDEIDRLINYRPTDDVATREASEYSKQKQIDMLTDELATFEKDNRDMQEKMFRTEERLLDLKFEKETFDLQYARLQKRITDLENYKLQASQLSAVLKQQYEEELE